jgi:hypothetical protein
MLLRNMPALPPGHNPVVGFPKRFGCQNISQRIGAESRPIRDKPIEIAAMMRCSVFFLRRNVDSSFSSVGALLLCAVANPAPAGGLAHLFKAL